MAGNRDVAFVRPASGLWLQHGAKCRMRRSIRIAAHVDDGMNKRHADGGRKSAAIVDVAGHATAIDELRTEFADLLSIDRVVWLRMRAIAKVRVMQPPPEHERLRIRRRDVPRQLLEAM